MEGTNAMFWRFEWRGRMLMNLAELAAYVRDVKPESDEIGRASCRERV